tara:strand:+ start:206 stop:685 length:480 start_codon:yes stop_codon:yes gene_type:complete
MSNYTNLPDKSLRVIIFTLNKEFDENNIDIEGNDIFEEDIVNLIDKTLEYFGIKGQTIELYSYFISLCLLNPGYLDKTVPIQRPRLNKYEVIHSESSRVWKTTTYKTVIPSYIELDKNMVNDLRGIELYDYWDGDIISDYVDDSETTDDEVEEINMIRK